MNSWWTQSVEEAAASWNTSLQDGLTSAEARDRLEKYGANQLTEQKRYSAWEIFFDQFKDFIIWVLVGAALVSGFLKEWVDALAIVAIVVLNAILGFIQEYRAEKSLAALKRLSSPSSKAIRDGAFKILPSAELVPGDIIELESGDNIPADSRLVYVTGNFATQEASLTGESTPVEKSVARLSRTDVPIAERMNMTYLGTFVVSGKAKAIVVETGMKTELGKVAGMIQHIEDDITPLQKKLEQFGKWIVYVCFVMVALVFFCGLMRGGSFLELFLTSVSLAVAAIPEGLPAVVTIALALGVQRMVKRHALIRKLPSVETLGCANVICSDKTGTLTRNEMTVQAIYAGDTLFRVTGVGYAPDGEILLRDRKITQDEAPQIYKTLLCGVLCNGSHLTFDSVQYRIIGDPTEGALLTAAAKIGIGKKEQEKEYSLVAEIPFDSARKKMAMVRSRQKELFAFVKGAPDVLLKDCTRIEEQGAARPLTDADRRKIAEANNDLTKQAMRVLALAYKKCEAPDTEYEAGVVEKELIFLGLVAMIDPPREEVKKAIQECVTAGIRTVMITGDHKNTAVAIATQLGFFNKDSKARTGEELEQISDEEFSREINRISVYARVSPEHKLRIVHTLRMQGAVVAMTGDGVNDAPAVKEADIGVAMGMTGTDVTKEVSDMIVTDDNFASIVAAVKEGRGIYDNIKKFIHYLLSCNTGEILVMFISSLVALPVPLLPIQILWVNLVTDGLPALALGMDPVDPDIMKRSPRPKDEPVVTLPQAMIMLLQGSFIALCSLTAFCFVYFFEKEGLDRSRTAAFIVLSCSQLFHAFNCRSMRQSLFALGITTNMKLVGATLVSFALQMLVVYVPFLQRIFKTEPLGYFDWFLVLGISSLPLWAMELVKVFLRKQSRLPH